MDKTAADILEIAADLYESETVNWCQEAWVNPDLTSHFEGVYTSPDWVRDWEEMPNEAASQINACVMGALALADGFTWQQNMQLGTENIIGVHGSDQLREAVAALDSHLSEQGPEEYPSNIPFWNDAEGRTKDEVIEAIKETAKGLRNREVAA